MSGLHVVAALRCLTQGGLESAAAVALGLVFEPFVVLERKTTEPLETEMCESDDTEMTSRSDPSFPAAAVAAALVSRMADIRGSELFTRREVGGSPADLRVKKSVTLDAWLVADVLGAGLLIVGREGRLVWLIPIYEHV